MPMQASFTVTGATADEVTASAQTIAEALFVNHTFVIAPMYFSQTVNNEGESVWQATASVTVDDPMPADTPAPVAASMFAVDQDLLGVLAAVLATTAVAVQYEDPATPQHTARAALATKVAADPTNYALRFAWACSTNATTVGKWVAGDHDGAIADLAFVVSTVWNAVAGVPAS